MTTFPVTDLSDAANFTKEDFDLMVKELNARYDFLNRDLMEHIEQHLANLRALV